jgi:hypothetical protein
MAYEQGIPEIVSGVKLCGVIWVAGSWYEPWIGKDVKTSVLLDFNLSSLSPEDSGKKRQSA